MNELKTQPTFPEKTKNEQLNIQIIRGKIVEHVTKITKESRFTSWMDLSVQALSGICTRHAQRELTTDREAPLPNPNYRPITEIIDEAIVAFSSDLSNPPIHSEKKAGRFRLRKFMGYLVQKITPEEAAYLEKYNIKTEANRTAFATLLSALKEGKAVNDVFTILEVKLPPELVNLLRNASQSDFMPQKYKKNKYEIFHEAKTFLQNSSQETPLSSSTLLVFFLKKNNGNLNESLKDVSFFLRWLARNTMDKSGNDSQKINQTTSEFTAMILDEFSTFGSFAELEADSRFLSDKEGETKARGLRLRLPKKPEINLEQSRANQIGKAYHSWHLVALLADLTPEMIGVLTAIEYHQFGHLHGWHKATTDLRVLLQLKQLETKFQKI